MEATPHTDATSPVTTIWLRDGAVRVPWKLASYTGASIALTVLFGVILLLLPLVPHDLAPAAFPFAVLCGVCAATTLCHRVYERQGFLDVGLHPTRRGMLQLGMGLFASASMLGSILLLEMLSGMVEVRFVQVTMSQSLRVLLSGSVLYLVVGVSEEVMMRGYPLQTLARRFGRWPALFLTAVIFAALHIPNPSVSWLGLLNIFLAGLWLGEAYLSTGALWLPIGLHVGWNFTMGSVAGFPVSGHVTRGLFLSAESGPDWLTGGAFGPEGGVLASVVLLLAFGAMRTASVRSFLGGTAPESAAEAKSTA